MRKLAVFFSMLCVSGHIFAVTNSSHPIGSAIAKSLQSKTKLTSTISASLIYGGQDISRSIIATADESLWAGQRTFVG